MDVSIGGDDRDLKSIVWILLPVEYLHDHPVTTLNIVFVRGTIITVTTCLDSRSQSTKSKMDFSSRTNSAISSTSYAKRMMTYDILFTARRAISKKSWQTMYHSRYCSSALHSTSTRIYVIFRGSTWAIASACCFVFQCWYYLSLFSDVRLLHYYTHKKILQSSWPFGP